MRQVVLIFSWYKFLCVGVQSFLQVSFQINIIADFTVFDLKTSAKQEKTATFGCGSVESFSQPKYFEAGDASFTSINLVSGWLVTAVNPISNPTIKTIWR